MKQSKTLFATLLAMTLASAAAPAAILCVGTVAELQQALTQAADDEIRLRSGQYLVSNTTLRANLLAGANLSISGGWQNVFGPCAVQSGNASATVLDGLGQHPVLSIEAASGSSDIVVSNLTIANGSRAANDNTVLAAGLGIFGAAAHTGSILVERVVFRFNQSPQPGAALSIVGNQGFVVRNSLFISNTAGAAAAMLLNSGQTAYLVNNTVTGSLATTAATSSAALAFVYSANSHYVLSNNIFWDNLVSNQSDMFTSAQVTLLSNDIEARAGAVSPLSVGNLSVDPGFVSPNDAHLDENSPLVDIGINGALGGVGVLDLDGLPRVVGSIDLGAYESNGLLADGFE